MSGYENTRWQIVAVLETEADYQQFLSEWRDPPKRCKCGATLPKGRHKCDGCLQGKTVRREYLREYYKKRRADERSKLGARN